jgi:hypothetical protein
LKLRWLSVGLVTVLLLAGCGPVGGGGIETATRVTGDSRSTPSVETSKGSEGGLTLSPMTGGTPVPSRVVEGAVTVVNYDKPPLVLDMSGFLEAGCTIDEYDRVNCGDGTPLTRLGLYGLRKPDDELAALRPFYPIARGQTTVQHEWSTPTRTRDQYLYNIGCPAPIYVGYIILQDGKPKLIETPAGFREIFAPVESAEEALAFAAAITGYYPQYGFEADSSFRYHVVRIEDTHVLEVEGGWLVNLRRYQLCGCGPHTVSEVVVKVTTDGQVEEVSRQPLYEDPKDDGKCVD